ncbi:MAG: hypothetical protein KAS99_00855, partial [Candidatus Omnitrophica bacterium]|nr:hypothetical protein [Candidatus Omnitrophota bacterium]
MYLNKNTGSHNKSTRPLNIHIWALALAVGICSFSFIPDARAVQVKKVQSGSVSFLTTDIAKTVPITEVDTTKSIILITIETGSLYSYGCLFTPEFYNPSTLYISRSDADAAATIGWTVIEFDEGVLVQRGNSDIPAGLTTRTAAIVTSVGTDKSFIIVYPRSLCKQTNTTECTAATAVFNSGSEIEFERRGAAATVTLGWQAVEFQTDASVQSGTLNIPSGSTVDSTTASLSPAVDVDKSFLVVTTNGHALAAGATGEFVVHGEIPDSGDGTCSILKFTRANSTNDVNISWFCVTLSDSSIVQPGVQSYSTTSDSVTLGTSVDVERAFPIMSTSLNAGFKDMDAYSIRSNLSSGSLAFTRVAAMSANIAWYVPELAPFTILTPDGGQTLKVGDPYDITWTTSSSANLEYINLKWSDNGTTWTDVAGAAPADMLDPQAKSFPWTILPVAAEIDTDCKVKMINTRAGYGEAEGYVDISDANFTIQSKLELQFPNGGESWLVGDNKDISWKYWGNFSPLTTVELEYSVDYPSYTIWNTIDTVAYNYGETGGICHYTWINIPLGAGGQNVKVRVKSSNNPIVIYDESNDPFIIQGSINLTKPVTDELWPTGYERNIEWTLNCGASASTTVDIYYSLDNGGEWSPVAVAQDADNVQSYNPGPGKGSYPWTPPLAQASNLAIIKVYITGDEATNGTVSFDITPSIQVDQPNAGTGTVFVDGSTTVEWTIGGGATDILLVDIFYCTDFLGAKTWVQIANDVDTTQGAGNTWPWDNIPDAITAQGGIKVESANHAPGTIYDESEGTFAIKGYPEILTPVLDYIAPANQNLTVTWKAHGDLTTAYGNTFNLEYSNNGGTGWVSLGAAYEGLSGGSTTSESKIVLSADIPLDNLGDSDSMLRLRCTDDSEVAGNSPTFYIRGDISNVATDLSEYNVGDVCTITWTSYPATWAGQPVTIEYDENGGAGPWDNIVIDSSTNVDAGTFPWTIPNNAVLGDNIIIRVKLSTDPTNEVVDVIDNSIGLYGNLLITRPTTSAIDTPLVWESGTQEAIT